MIERELPKVTQTCRFTATGNHEWQPFVVGRQVFAMCAHCTFITPVAFP